MTKLLKSKFFKYLPLVLLLSVTVWLRIANLGYSDYQGDEIKAFYKPEPGQSISEFFLDQRKGPVQFFITYLIKIFHPTYTNEFLTRFPFALAGILAILFFYKFVRLHYGEKIAYYSTFFLSVNGIIVALTRIVQYQPYVILFAVLALYSFSLAWKNEKWKIKGLYAGMIFWGLSILSHYDGVFICPYVIYILWNWFKEHGELTKRDKIKHFLFSSIIGAVLVLSFYVPFILSVSQSTADYWLDRLSGGEGKLSSSIITFKVYNPTAIYYIYAALGLLSIVKMRKFLPVVLWFLFPWIFMEIITSVPGTHIYNYIIPGTIAMGFGVTVVEDSVKDLIGNRLGEILNMLGLLSIFVFMFYVSNQVYIDHKKEYPWEEEKILAWDLKKPNVIFHLSMFGFPYYRHWEEIGEFVTTTENNGFYSTNERSTISRHYVPFDKDTDSAGHYIFVYSPQSFTEKFIQEKAKYWAENHPPVKTFEKDGKTSVEIYYMPEGNLEEIQALGY